MDCADIYRRVSLLSVLSWLGNSQSVVGAASSSIARSRVSATFISTSNFQVRRVAEVYAAHKHCKQSLFGARFHELSWRQRYGQCRGLRTKTPVLPRCKCCCDSVDVDSCCTCENQTKRTSKTTSHSTSLEDSQSAEDYGLRDRDLSRRDFVQAVVGSTAAVLALSLVRFELLRDHDHDMVAVHACNVLSCNRTMVVFEVGTTISCELLLNLSYGRW